jgi:hypothetical protein
MTIVFAFIVALASRVVFASLWHELAPEDSDPTGPAPRLGAASLDAAPALLLTGGCSSSCCYSPLDDMWAFTGGAWVNVSQVNAPSGRLYHGASPAAMEYMNSSQSFLQSWYVFGGDDINTGVLSELLLVTAALNASPPTASWRLLGGGGGDGPPARASHSQSALPARAPGAPADGSFLVFGGIDSDAATLGDAWVFTPAAAAGGGGAWARLAPAAGAPAPAARAQHAALALALGGGARAVAVSGGADVAGDDSDELWALAVDAAPPQWLLLGAGGGARHGHAIFGGAAPGAAPGDVALTLFLFGGQNSSVPDPANFLGDAWRFDVALRVAADGSLSLSGGAPGRFTLLDGGGGSGEPGPRALGAYASRGAELLYAGGFSGYNGGTDDRLKNDVWLADAAAPRRG